jgi:hypothetical protein
MYASAEGHDDAVKVLLDAGADLKLQNKVPRVQDTLRTQLEFRTKQSDVFWSRTAAPRSRSPAHRGIHLWPNCYSRPGLRRTLDTRYCICANCLFAVTYF